MNQDPRVAPVTSSAGGPRRASVLAAAIVVALVLAIAKPWSLGAAGQGPDATREPRVTATAPRSSGNASASPSAPAGDPNAMACLADETEQVVTLEHSAGREVRSWIAVPALVATGPLDPRLVPLTIFSSHVVGLGVCAAGTAAGSSPVDGTAKAGSDSGATLTDVRSIAIVSGVVMTVDLGPPSLLPGALNDQDPALLYGPPQLGSAASPGGHAPESTHPPVTPSSPSPSADQLTWRAGSYAVAFRFPSDAVTVVRWLRVDLLAGAGGGA